MIEPGADVNAVDAAGWAALHHIAYQCYGDYYFDPNAMLQILVDSGADINARGMYGMTPIMLAAMYATKHPKALETVKLLLNGGADFEARDEHDNDVWYWMCDYFYSKRHFEKLILQEILSEMCRSTQPDKAGADVINPVLEEILFEMYNSTQPDKAGADVINPVPLPAVDLDLMTAAFWGTAEDLASILARGADINATSQHGYTPLMFASVYNHAPAVKFLIEQGANLDAKNFQGNAALTLAIQTGDISMIRTLLDAGADVNAKDEDGRTALMHIAADSSQSIDVARVLIRAGADVNALDSNGQTALGITLNEAGYEHNAFIQFLIANGADPKLMPLERTKETGKLKPAMEQSRFKLMRLLLAAGDDYEKNEESDESNTVDEDFRKIDIDTFIHDLRKEQTEWFKKYGGAELFEDWND
jgi:ankyrin repeat protein